MTEPTTAAGRAHFQEHYCPACQGDGETTCSDRDDLYRAILAIEAQARAPLEAQVAALVEAAERLQRAAAKAHDERVDAVAYKRGWIEGVTLYAWWRDGVEYVGTCGRTLKKAIAEQFPEGGPSHD